MSDAFQTFIGDSRIRVDAALNHYLPNVSTNPNVLHQAMRYTTLSQGKRIRPLLVYASGHLLDVAETILDAIAAAIECIHSYSLIHDDLPAMDDDDLRRGQPTCHKQYDEATAILAGDALQTLAFNILSHPIEALAVDRQLKLIHQLALAAGSRGMAGGQAMDLASTGQSLTLPELENMHIHKTGALIRASVTLPLLCQTSATEADRNNVDHYAKCIGLAFQIHDDILDVESTTEVLGKTGQKDLQQDKVTYPALLGLDEAKEKRQSLYQQALKSIEPFAEKAKYLQDIANLIIHRDC